MKGHRRALAAAATLASLAGGGAIAFAAGSDNSPRTDPTTAAIRFASAEGKLRTCTGQDGFYSESPFTAVGVVTGDPRLTGTAYFTVKELIKRLPNFTPLLGTSEGSLVIRDTATNRKKAEADFHGVIESDIQYGVIVGKVYDVTTARKSSKHSDDDHGDRRGADLVANYRLQGEAGAPTMHLGGTWTNSRIPAVIQSGRCNTKYEPFSATFP